MAVLFPTPVGYTLNPSHQAEILQGLVNMQNAVGSTNGLLTKSQMTAYQQQHANVADSTTAVANYLDKNFDYLSAMDGQNDTISVDDLVRLKASLPDMPNVSNPPVLVNGWPPAATQVQTSSAVPVLVPVPVMVQASNTTSNGQSSNTTFSSSAPSAQDMSQLMLLLLSQMLQMFQSLFTPNTYFQ